ncbi:hypothetical protein [Streptomyces sp. NPDC057838]|uniref:hypothetical protein n=1 Tax=unclassified Streptomyces TaxID=2593676 RepID=UPI0036A45E90
MPARLPSWAWTTGLTVGAIAAVTVLAVQADKGPHPTASSAKPSAPVSAQPTPTASAPARVPDGSGTGRRIVYSLGEKRVWMVDASEATRRTFTVWPGTVSPDPGTYAISSRNAATTGSDGVQIEHIMYFAAQDGVSVAFSNAVDGSSPPPAASGGKTGGVRMKKADGTALWAFGTVGTTVAVVR